MKRNGAMKHQRFARAVILLFVVSTQVSYGQNPLGPQPKKARTPADYVPRTLKEIATREFDARNGAADDEKLIVNGDIHPSRVRVTYAGRDRPLPQNKKHVLHRWAQLFAGAPMHYTAAYESELLFKADGMKYWLAFKKDSIAQFKKEIRAGKAVDLFLIRLGGALDGDKWQPLLLVESFEKLTEKPD